MHLVDMKTLMILFSLNEAMCCVIIAVFWFENRKRTPEFAYWFTGFLCQFIGFLLIAFRGAIPGFVSIVVATLIMLYGMHLLLVGIERYAGLRSFRGKDYFALALLVTASMFFTYVWENIGARNINFSLGLIFFCVQIAYLVFCRAKDSFRATMRPVGIIAVFFIAINIARILDNIRNHSNVGFFDLDTINIAVLVASELATIAFTFSIIMMVARRLRIELEEDLVERSRVTDELWRSKERFSHAFQTSPNSIVISLVSTGQILEVNDTFVEKTGFTREETLSKTVRDLNVWVDERDRDLVVDAIARGESVTEHECRFRNKNGSIIDALFSSQILDLEQGQCILSTIQDITFRKHAEEEILKSQRIIADERQRLAYILEATDVGTCEWIVDDDRMMVNERWANIVGHSAESLGSLTFEGWMGFVHPEDRTMVRDAIEKNLSGALRYFDREFRLLKNDGSTVWVHDRGKVVYRNEIGNAVIMCGTRQDITDRKRDEEIIRHMATHDLLTDLPTRRLAADRLELSIAMAKRLGHLLAVFFIDADGFKAVNDTWGHTAGDRVLKEIARRLNSCVRESDTAARIGGDEFLAAFSNLKTREDARIIAEKMIEQFSHPVVIAEGSVPVGISVGIAIYPDNGESVDALIKAADHAMYRVKRTGKNSYSFAEGNS